MTTMWQQQSLFQKQSEVRIAIDKDHELVKLADMIKWKTLIKVAMIRREEARKSQSGPQPRYRQLLGALVPMSMKNLNYRDVEDQIANYVPARYLCDLLDSTWTPDHGTIFHFAKMLGAQGIKHLNNEILLHAQSAGLANPQELMSDTTAQ